MRRFSSEIEKFLDGLDMDFVKTPKATSQRQPRRTVTLSAEIYERLKDYAAQHGKSMNDVVNQKLDSILPTPEDEAEIDVILAVATANDRGDRGCQYLN